MSINDRNNRLTDLAERVKAAEGAMNAASKEMGLRAIEAGKLLLEAKGECPHGGWLPFLERAGMQERQAQRLMSLVNAGIKSDTVSEIGMRAALELAAKRKLPAPNQVLVAWVGRPQKPPPWPAAVGGEITAFIYENSSMPDFMHVVAWRDRIDGAEAWCTVRPISRSRPDFVFQTVDKILRDRQSEMSLTTLGQVADLDPSALHKIVLEDRADNPLGVAIT